MTFLIICCIDIFEKLLNNNGEEMALTFEKIEIRNFLSFGNNYQTMELNKKEFQLIIGLNKDKGDSSSNRSGVGKSSITQAIHFALFGKSIGNKINLPFLVNAINKKNCEVKLYFSRDDKHYIIHRGRSPQFLKFYVDGTELTDMAQGNNRDTQEEINRVLGFNEDIYNQIICLTPTIDNFLQQPLQKQRTIIESVLGVNQLTEKAEQLKEKNKDLKLQIKNEQFLIEKTKNTNNATIENYKRQQAQMQSAYDKWEVSNDARKKELAANIAELNKIDIEAEKKAFKELQEYNQIVSENEEKKQKVMKMVQNIQNYQTEINTITETINKLNAVNIVEEEKIHTYNQQLAQEESEYKTKLLEHKQNELKLKALNKEFMSIGDRIKKVETELENVSKNICPTCGQEIGKEESEKLIKQKQADKSLLQENYHKTDLEILELNHLVQSFEVKTFDYKTGYYKNYQDMVQHKFNLEKLNSELERKNKELIDTLTEAQNPELKPKPLPEVKPTPHYKKESEIIEHNIRLEQYISELNKLNSDENVNPYKLQLENLANPPLIPIDEEPVIQMEKELRHSEILLKLLSSPDSYIRKTIIDTNLQYLNEKIKFYLAKMNSLHTVIFNNDMSVSIWKAGVEYGHVSTGEESTVDYAMMFAFRELWESLNFPVNLMFIDEKLDKAGLDTAGIEFLVALLKEYVAKNNKNLHLVSHREELIKENDDIFTVVMENGFTNIEENE